MTTKKSIELSLKDKLSRLNYLQACKLLGEDGDQLIRRGGTLTIDIDQQVRLSDDEFRLEFLPPNRSIVTLRLRDDATRRIHWHCSTSTVACDEVGAALSLILEEKTSLGLAAAPDPSTPVENLSEAELLTRALAERAQRAREEKMSVRSTDAKRPWADYLVTSKASGKTYRVALRGEQRGLSYCSCPDYRKNTLGTCKHVMHVLAKVKRRFSASQRRRPFRQNDIFVHLQYGEDLTLRMGLPQRLDADVQRVVRPIKDRDIVDLHDLVRRLGKLERLGQTVTVYPDAEEYIQQGLFLNRIEATVAEIRHDPARHPLRRELLKVDLLPFQLDGIAFAVGAGRAVLADDMGLGKTIQGVGVAELLARKAGIRRVLVVCPASLKAQWRGEIERFCDRTSQLVVGSAAARARQYDSGCFFTICNYEQVLRDILSIERVKWDLIILDEGQRIKNWETKTSNVIKSLKSPFALVLSGTPLENRLDDLYNVVGFIDDRRLAPAFRFFHRHRVVDEGGKVLGYKNLDQLRETLKPVLLRRTRESVMNDLPARTTEIVRITPTDEQVELHMAHMQTVVSIARKPFLTEMDMLRLQKALLMCRLAANSTFLVNKQKPGYSSKLEQLDDLLDRLFQERDRKAILFSEWTNMLNLIEPQLEKRSLGYVRLDGKVPQKKRQQLVHRFQNNGDCKLFITTNAGSTGLNLQAANTVINVDLPWNPAVLEQRIARAHRMGQKRPVHVFVLISEGTIEESLLNTLSAKHQLALAALDVNSDVDRVDLVSGMEELKRRLELLLGAKPEAELDQSVKTQREEEQAVLARRERIAQAGGDLLGAAFNFLGEFLPDQSDTPNLQQRAADLKKHLSECIDTDEAGKLRLTVTLPDPQALDDMANSLARLLAAGKK